MSRVKRFEEFRFVGVRDTMTVYDTDDADQTEALQARIDSDDLVSSKQVQAFGPDTEEEARNRGFSPA
ncbi:MAG: hypothetical protein ACFCU2_05135 [Acidimicrobiia bacterium]